MISPSSRRSIFPGQYINKKLILILSCQKTKQNWKILQLFGLSIRRLAFRGALPSFIASGIIKRVRIMRMSTKIFRSKGQNLGNCKRNPQLIFHSSN